MLVLAVLVVFAIVAVLAIFPTFAALENYVLAQSSMMAEIQILAARPTANQLSDRSFCTNEKLSARTLLTSVFKL